MIVKFMSAGKSFKGLATYLTHDPDKAKTADRVAFTHTLNLAHDHVPSAVNECLWTARQAELLKQEAGIRGGGRELQHPVKHASLNWHPDDTPTRDHMISASEEFLRHMGWQDHQVILVAHQEKHPHVHLMINVVHPETGLKLDDSFERRRASEWSLAYERSQNRVHCEQRLLDPDDRYDAPTRPAWMAFREKELEFSRAENRNLHLENHEENNVAEFSDWKKLKEIQRRERVDFFAEGKSEFKSVRNAVFREVREEYREKWAEYFSAKRDGADPEVLAEMKAGIVAEQKLTLEERRDAACADLREIRDERYRALLAEQGATRANFRAREELGLDNSIFLDRVESRSYDRNVPALFRDAADEQTRPSANPWEVESPAFGGRQDRGGMKSGTDIGINIGEGLAMGVAGLFESLADGLTNSRPARPPPRRRDPEPSGPNPFEIAAEEAKKAAEIENRRDAEDEWRKKQRNPWE
jgi:hypothetical protein